MRLQLDDEAATQALGQQLAAALPVDCGGWTLLLRGDLGAGKSTLARALIKALGHTGPVPSPTYTLIEPYDLGDRKIYHVDLYRIADEGELHFLGFDELGDGLKLVEWPERAPSLEGRSDLLVDLQYQSGGRDVEIVGISGRGSDLERQLRRIMENEMQD